MDQPPPQPAAPILARPAVRGALAVLLLAALAAAAWFAVGRGDGSGPGADVIGERTSSNGGATSDAQGPLDSRAPVIGQPAPDFELARIDGSLVRLSDLRGKVVWINFWATWCQPCRKELPDVQKLYDELRADGLEVLALDWKDPADEARAYFDEAGLTLPMLLDHDGSVYDQYRLQGLPDSFFIDREGNLAALHFGYLTEKKMRERLKTAGIE